MAFKKTTYISIAFKNQRPIEIRRVSNFDDKTDSDNDRGKTFDGSDLNKGIRESSLSLEIRYRTDEELVVLLEKGFNNLDDDGCTVTILDGKIYNVYTGCFDSSFNPSHGAESKPVLKIDLDVTNKEDPVFA